MYHVGAADWLDEDDATFTDEPDALAYAIALSYNDHVIAVWDADDEVVCLVFQQRPYYP